jgi:prepilin-type N-terminal cleavage/methylation domain-containing protein
MCIKTNHRSGFTLIEMLFAAGLSSLILLVIACFSMFSARSCAALANYDELETQSRLALDRMTQQIRQTKNLTSGSSTNLVFRDSDGNPLEFVYGASSKTLVRIKGGVSTILLRGCDYLKFEIFQRNPIKGTYNAYPTATAGTCKLVQVTWSCSRRLLCGENTETVQSAKIVIRKRS